MAASPLVPVVLKDDAFAPPDAETYYVVAGNGFFMERRTDLYTATVAVDGGVPGLQPHAAQLDLRLPHKLPRPLVESALGFFRAMYERWEAEGIVVMFMAPADGDRPARYRLDAPPQTIRGWVDRGRFRADLRLDYGACEKPGPAWRKLGTFHSHAAYSPHHSAVDARDELWETGLHLTAGYVHSSLPEFEASFVVNGARFPLPVDEVLVRPHGIRSFPKAWLEQVTVVEEAWGQGKGRGDAYGYPY